MPLMRADFLCPLDPYGHTSLSIGLRGPIPLSIQESYGLVRTVELLYIASTHLLELVELDAAVAYGRSYRMPVADMEYHVGLG